MEMHRHPASGAAITVMYSTLPNGSLSAFPPHCEMSAWRLPRKERADSCFTSEINHRHFDSSPDKCCRGNGSDYGDLFSTTQQPATDLQLNNFKLAWKRLLHRPSVRRKNTEWGIFSHTKQGTLVGISVMGVNGHLFGRFLPMQRCMQKLPGSTHAGTIRQSF